MQSGRFVSSEITFAAVCDFSSKFDMSMGSTIPVVVLSMSGQEFFKSQDESIPFVG